MPLFVQRWYFLNGRSVGQWEKSEPGSTTEIVRYRKFICGGDICWQN